MFCYLTVKYLYIECRIFQHYFEYTRHNYDLSKGSSSKFRSYFTIGNKNMLQFQHVSHSAFPRQITGILVALK